MSIVISVENLSKYYRLGVIGSRTLRDDLERWWSQLRGRPDPRLKIGTINPDNRDRNFIWALREVSFEVEQGEILGIIGRNGAGKSTLLKILSRVTAPTSGEVKLKGLTASLLEVGTGFHPDLTGRENIFVNGAILGMRKAEIDRKLDEIIDFSGVEQFIDTPVKRYSSGMHVRLAFAVAAHLEPEILVIDEVLAVGDAAFQKKCLNKMHEASYEGRTVLFVSHNLEAIRKLTKRSLLLDQGRISAHGETKHVLGIYIKEGEHTKSVYLIPPPQDANSVPGYAHKLIIEDGSGQPAAAIPVGQPWQIRVLFKITQRIDHFIIGLGFRTNMEIPLRTSWSEPRTLQPGSYYALFREETVLLSPGRYTIVVGLSAYERTLQYTENAGALEIAEFSEALSVLAISNVGLVLNPLSIEIVKANE